MACFLLAAGPLLERRAGRGRTELYTWKDRVWRTVTVKLAERVLVAFQPPMEFPPAVVPGRLQVEGELTPSDLRIVIDKLRAAREKLKNR